MAVWKYGMAGQDLYYRDLAREYGKTYPGGRERPNRSDPEREAHGLLERWARDGNAPDLSMMPDVWLAEFAPLLERYAAQLPREFLGRFEPVMLERSRYQGAMLGLVWAASTETPLLPDGPVRKRGLETAGPPGTSC